MVSLDRFIFIHHVYYAAIEIGGKIWFTKNIKASLINEGFGLNILLNTELEAYTEGFETLLLPRIHR